MPGSDNVVTVFCCGTSFHRDKENEAIADMFRWCDSERKWINDGPGSTGHEIQKVEHLFKEGQKPGRLQSVRGTGPYALGGQWGWIKGAIGGRGTNDNVLVTLQWLWLEYYKKPFKVCNLTGWSRGAVTTIAIANAMHLAGFGALGVRINIFAYDPVPGDFNDFSKGGNFGSSGRAGIENISPIVDNYHSILMENVGDLKGALFKCIDPSETGGNRKRTYPLMGGHSDCVKWNEDRNPAGKIGLTLGIKFLQEHGTVFLAEGSSQILNNFQLLEEYSALRRDWLEKCNWKPKTRGVDIWRSGTVVNQFRDGIYFVNGHHFELFKELLPDICLAATGTRVIGSDKLAALKIQFPLTIPVLRYLKVIRDPSSRAADKYADAIFEIEVLPAQAEINRVGQPLTTALGGSRPYTKNRPASRHNKLWTLEEWKQASSVTIGSRRDQVLVIDRLLPVYHEAGPKNRVSQFWLLFPIAKQITSHLKEKGIRSDRHLAMAQLGRQVRNVLRGDIPQRWNG